MWTAAILAGGQGRRLGGRDKSALQVGGQSILTRQIAILRPLTAHILIIASGIGDPGSGIGDDVRIVHDRIAGAGALGGLYTALMEAPTEHVIVIACDMPFVTAPFVAELARAGADVDALVPRDGDGRHPLCASYHTRIAPHLKRCIEAGALRITDALRDLDVREMGPDELLGFNRDGRLLLNVNTPADYLSAVALAEADDLARLATRRDA